MTRIANRIVSFVLAITMITLTATAATAQVGTAVTPTGTFGAEPGLTFGGSGIDNNYVMTNGNATQLGAKVALSITPRYSNPPVTNNGAGVFYAMLGADPGQPGNTGSNFAKWNFDFAVLGTNVLLYDYILYVDNNPASGNSNPTYTTSNGYAYIPIAPPAVGYQDSWNLGMDFLSLAFPPAAWTFDPTVTGEYGFALAVINKLNGQELDRAAILLNVNGTGTAEDVVPEPATMTMLATGLVGIAGAGAKRRKNKKPRMSAEPLA